MLALLIRHGRVENQDRIGLREHLPLSEGGRAQVRALADRLRRREMAAIFTSPLRRTSESAEILAAGRGIPVTPEPALTEVNPGAWENRRFRDLAEDPVWKSFNSFRSGTKIPGGEMMIEVQNRAVGFLERISHEYAGRTAAIVTHADVIRAVICHYAGIPIDLCLRIEIGTASLSILQIETWGARLIRLNDVGED